MDDKATIALFPCSINRCEETKLRSVRSILGQLTKKLELRDLCSVTAPAIGTPSAFWSYPEVF